MLRYPPVLFILTAICVTAASSAYAQDVTAFRDPSNNDIVVVGTQGPKHSLSILVTATFGLRGDPPRLLVAGQDGTTVNGEFSRSFAFPIGDLVIDLKHSLESDVNIRNLSLAGGGGGTGTILAEADYITLSNVTSGGEGFVLTGNQIRVDRSTARVDLFLKTVGAYTSANVTNCQINRELEYRTTSNDTLLKVTNTNVDRNIDASTGGGVDKIVINNVAFNPVWDDEQGIGVQTWSGDDTVHVRNVNSTHYVSIYTDWAQDVVELLNVNSDNIVVYLGAQSDDLAVSNCNADRADFSGGYQSDTYFDGANNKFEDFTFRFFEFFKKFSDF